jgi:16S rRNA processing protein RimM
MATAGRVGRPHGLDGSFHVTRPEPVFAVGLETSLGVVVRAAGTPAKPIVRLEGVNTREAAEALRGQPLVVDRSVLGGLEEGEYWAEDLVGLRVVDGGAEVGVVARVRALPSCEVLEVGERLIPLVDDAVRTIDLDAGVIDVDLGFVDGG